MPVVFVDTATASLTNMRSYLATATTDVRATAAADGQLAEADAALKSSLLVTTAIVEKAIATILGVFSAKSKYQTVKDSSVPPKTQDYNSNLVVIANGVSSATANGAVVAGIAATEATNSASSAVSAGQTAVATFANANTELAGAFSSLAATLETVATTVANTNTQVQTIASEATVATLPVFADPSATDTLDKLLTYATFLNTLTSIQKKSYMESNPLQYNQLLTLIKAALEKAKTAGVALTEANVTSLLSIINASGYATAGGKDLGITLSADDFKTIRKVNTIKAEKAAIEANYVNTRDAVATYLSYAGFFQDAQDFLNIRFSDSDIKGNAFFNLFINQTIELNYLFNGRINYANPTDVNKFTVSELVQEIRNFLSIGNKYITDAFQKIIGSYDGDDLSFNLYPESFIANLYAYAFSSYNLTQSLTARNTALETQFEALASARTQEAKDPLNDLIDSVLGYML